MQWCNSACINACPWCNGATVQQSINVYTMKYWNMVQCMHAWCNSATVYYWVNKRNSPSMYTMKYRNMVQWCNSATVYWVNKHTELLYKSMVQRCNSPSMKYRNLVIYGAMVQQCISKLTNTLPGATVQQCITQMQWYNNTLISVRGGECNGATMCQWYILQRCGQASHF